MRKDLKRDDDSTQSHRALRTKPLRRPSVQASRHRRLVTAVLWRNVKADDGGIGNQGREIAWLEKQPWFGVHSVEGSFRQGVVQLAGASCERGQRGGTKDRQTDIGEAARSAQTMQQEGQAMPQRKPVRRQFILVH